MSSNYSLKQTMLNSIGIFVVILRCWGFVGSARWVHQILVLSLLVEQQSFWTALRADPLVAKGRTNNIKAQRHQEATCKQRKGFITAPLHKIRFSEGICQSFAFQRRNILRIRVMFPKISDAKLKGGIFVGPQIATILKSRTRGGLRLCGALAEI